MGGISGTLSPRHDEEEAKEKEEEEKEEEEEEEYASGKLRSCYSGYYHGAVVALLLTFSH